jgi:UDP-4-amino-4,6-dideoxy-N-acetyl-beta-L-altrosamine N-acetyltransferase
MMTSEILRPLTLDHLELVRTWRNSPAVAQYMYTADPISAEQQQAWYERISQDPTVHYWLIYYQERPVGVANLYAISQRNRSCYWAFYLGDSALHGSGIGAKVELAVLTYVFEELKLNKLACEVFVTNEKVIAMHEKFGFRREAYFRQHIYKDKAFIDVVGLAMLRREWQQVRDALRPRPRS